MTQSQFVVLFYDSMIKLIYMAQSCVTRYSTQQPHEFITSKSVKIIYNLKFSPSGPLAAFQLFTSYMWSVATTLDSVCELSCSVVSDSSSPWSVALQVSLSMGILQVGILEWVTMPFSRGSSEPRDQTQVSCIIGGFFTV